jgi:A/G-specific adenine glycosylase
MLQQTRAQAVIPYYERFLSRFPSAGALAAAPEQEALKAWSGLGYYQRARNLRRAAARIVELGGFPRDYDAIRDLPGVGAYTAAAVGSIAFGIPRAAVDGNVLRVIARWTGDASDIGSGAVRVRFEETASGLLDRRNPGGFNQAMMELGATVCLPRNPQCAECPVAAHCRARIEGTQAQLPVKLRRVEPVQVEATLLVVERKGKILFWRRDEDARRLGGFWELPAASDLPRAKAAAPAGTFRHSITHHRYVVTVVRASVPRAPERFEWLDRAGLAALPLSTTARKALALLGMR